MDGSNYLNQLDSLKEDILKEEKKYDLFINSGIDLWLVNPKWRAGKSHGCRAFLYVFSNRTEFTAIRCKSKRNDFFLVFFGPDRLFCSPKMFDFWHEYDLCVCECVSMMGGQETMKYSVFDFVVFSQH